MKKSTKFFGYTCGKIANILFQSRSHKNNDKNVITFTRTCNPNHKFSFNKFNNCIKNTTNGELQKIFNDKKILLTT